MDILRKIFGIDENEKENGNSNGKERYSNDFRKPPWFDETDSDDDLFDSNKMFPFHIFTNPMEMQKFFGEQIQDILKSLDEFEAIKPEDFEFDQAKDQQLTERKDLFDELQVHKDTDLDDQEFADQLKTLIRRITPPPTSEKLGTEVIKRTDQETIWDRIHGTDPNYQESITIKRKPNTSKSLTKLPRSGVGVFGDSIIGGQPSTSSSSSLSSSPPPASSSSSTKMFRQSVITRTMLKPDGTYETRKTVTDGDGNSVTTITKTHEGKTKTFTYKEGGENDKKSLGELRKDSYILPCDRNIIVTKSGYALPNISW